MLLNVCFLFLRLLFFEKFAGAPKAKSINMVWGTHIARVKTKNILNVRIGLYKALSSYVEKIVLRTDYLRRPLFVGVPPPVGGFEGALVSALSASRLSVRWFLTTNPPLLQIFNKVLLSFFYQFCTFSQ